MKSLKRFFSFLIFFLPFAQIISAQKSDSIPSNQPGFFIEGFVGFPSYCTMGRNNEAVELSTGTGPFALTGRFYRTKGTQGYFFENAIELGWKKNFSHYFTNTLSAGYSDLAFEKDVTSGPDFGYWNFNKADGFILEEKFTYSFHGKNRVPSPFGIAASYYYIFNSIKPVQGLSLGIDLNFEDIYWQNSRRQNKNENREKKKRKTHEETVPDSAKKSEVVIPYHYRIRTNFITGMFFSPHIDFEHLYSKNFGWGFGFFVRYKQHDLLGLFTKNPDIQLKGAGGFVDWIYFKPSWRNDHYWTFGARCGYRYLMGNCWYGDKLYEPDFYIDRIRQDIVFAGRVSFVMPPMDSHWSIDMYLSIGGRASYYKTSQPQYATYFNPSGYDSFPTNGCYLLPELAGGFEFGFGW
jgi:hypothetical protein